MTGSCVGKKRNCKKSTQAVITICHVIEEKMSLFGTGNCTTPPPNRIRKRSLEIRRVTGLALNRLLIKVDYGTGKGHLLHACSNIWQGRPLKVGEHSKVDECVLLVRRHFASPYNTAVLSPSCLLLLPLHACWLGQWSTPQPAQGPSRPAGNKYKAVGSRTSY